jgi:polyisoprenoid-binding protein YceI
MDGMQTTQELAPPQLGRYEIDTAASSVTFQTRHMFGLGGVRGTFAIRTGMADVTAPLSDSSIYVEIDATSFASGNRQRDTAVRSARLLHVERHPIVKFVCQGVSGPLLEGALTVRGVDRPVTLNVESCVASPAGFTARATTRIDRTEFGVTAFRGVAARYLEMTVDARFVRR